MDQYFKKLNESLRNYKRAIPFLLIDLDLLDKNIAELKDKLRSDQFFRIVVKSLPCIDLINYVMEKAETNNLMVFHQPFLSDLAQRLDGKSDILMGKPMPVKTAEYFYEQFLEESDQGKFDPFSQIQWLVDTFDRLEQYLELANKLGSRIRVNLEIDVGLHRGGFSNLESLRMALDILNANTDKLEFSGLMGYDPHVVKLPIFVRSQKKAFEMANGFYTECKELLKNEFPELYRRDLTFNGAGSPTISLHRSNDSPLNDVSAGSCLVKPTTFDVDTLSEFVPATFIAAPILKKLEGTSLPAAERAKGLLNFFNTTHEMSYFLYGGFWKADFFHPKGVKQNSMFVSTNQTMLNAAEAVKLEVDDFVFLRPHQSEFVFLQFGNILTVRDGEIAGEWSLLDQKM